MRIWRFSSPADDRFASAGRRGSWTSPQDEGVCPECSASRQQRAKPLVIAWELGSDVVGDFVWPGFGGEVVVTDRVLGVLQERFSGFEPGRVEMVEDPNSPQARPRKPQVRLPYEGPSLHELWVTTWVHLDRDRSSVELERRCGTCGTEFWNIYGVERWDSHFDVGRRQLVRTKTERLPNAGAFVREADLGGADIFRVYEFPGWVFCTDLVREVIKKEEFSNVTFLEMGETY